MALPRSKYSDPKHTPGKEFLLSGKDYVGWYVVTYQDKYFTGKLLDSSSKQLVPVQQQSPPRLDVFIAQPVTPTEDDRIAGIWNRYFIQNRKTKAIIEVSKQRYQAFDRKGNFSRAELKWKLKGPADNVNKGPYTYFGAEHINRVNTQALENTIPGISSFIKDYSEFVE